MLFKSSCFKKFRNIHRKISASEFLFNFAKFWRIAGIGCFLIKAWGGFSSNLKFFSCSFYIVHRLIFQSIYSIVECTPPWMLSKLSEQPPVLEKFYWLAWFHIRISTQKMQVCKSQFPADVVTFTNEIFNRKLQFMCSA